MSCEYCGTFSVMPSAPPSGLGGTCESVWDGSADDIAPTIRTAGLSVVPACRYSVTRSRHEVSVTPLAATNVSVATVPFASDWPPTEVRWIWLSSAAQRPITYHVVVVPAPVVPCRSTWTQLVPGVSAFQDATRLVRPKPGL